MVFVDTLPRTTLPRAPKSGTPIPFQLRVSLEAIRGQMTTLGKPVVDPLGTQVRTIQTPIFFIGASAMPLLGLVKLGVSWTTFTLPP